MRLLFIGIYNATEQQMSLRKALASICDDYKEYNFDSHKNINNILATTNAHVVFMQIQREGVIRPSVVRDLKKKGVKIFNFTGDVRQPLPNWYVEMAPYVTSLFTNLTDVEYIRARGFKAEYFQVGYNTHFYNTTGHISAAPRIVFMGNNYRDSFPLSQLRVEMVTRLRRKYGSDFAVYGSGWGICQNLNANQSEEGAVYRGCEIAINLSHFDLKRYSSDRLFRILGCGTFCLSHRFQEIEKEFVDGRDLVAWDNLDDLEKKIDYYLSHSDEAKEIAKNGNRLCEHFYTWDYRIRKDLIKYIDELD
jgi:hypothetical protein